VTPVVVHELRDGKLTPLAISERIAGQYGLREGQEVQPWLVSQLIAASAGYELGFTDATERASKIISGQR
jgi:hypothetical protein